MRFSLYAYLNLSRDFNNKPDIVRFNRNEGGFFSFIDRLSISHDNLLKHTL